MSHWQLLLLGTGIIWGMFYYQRTGWACGGIITPGLLALNMGSPEVIAFSLACGLILSVMLEIAVRVFSLYGRQRIAFAMVLAIILRMATLKIFPGTSLWVGWIIPALIASDIQKQGLFKTLSGVVSVTLVSLMTFESLRYFMMLF
ncbi:MAG TPA: poly-gamma-glutamate biosynthesis protein PgsC/CapC [Synergistales bacterium]|nr:poly-gamma-glutamate biosynthesis protein PgsC/CapC [Synergistales bacterium]